MARTPASTYSRSFATSSKAASAVVDRFYRISHYPKGRVLVGQGGTFFAGKSVQRGELLGVLAKGARTRGRRLEAFEAVYVR